MTLRWGVAGAGRISHDFVNAVRTLPVIDHKFVAVAAISKENAEKFAVKHDIPRSYGGYWGLTQDTETDIIYVGNLNTQHYETTKMMLEHGKHVLVEKPFTMNERQTRRLYEIATEKKLFLMEAMWSRCFPAYTEMKRIIDNGEIGEVLFVSVTFGQARQSEERLISKELGGGAILNLGCYVLQFQQFVFRELEPLKITVNGHLNSYGSDECCGVMITYPNGKMAIGCTSVTMNLPNEGIVVGTKGTLRLPDFWSPTKLLTPTGVIEWPLPQSSLPYHYRNSAGLRYEAQVVRQCISTGKIESPNITHEESIKLAKLMDYLRKEMEITFPEDFQEF